LSGTRAGRFSSGPKYSLRRDEKQKRNQWRYNFKQSNSNVQQLEE
jgi:hypothetical protein